MKAARVVASTCVLLLAGFQALYAQAPLKGYMISLPAHNPPSTNTGKVAAQLAPNVVPIPIPLWKYSVTAYNGGQYSGTIMGLSPYNHGKTTTTIPVQIVPLVITITDSNGTYVYDPTVEDTACVPGHTPTDIIANSPIFTSEDWVMSGTDMGSTQYEDANVRAEFWQLVGNTPYHLNFQETTLSSQALSFGTGGTSGAGVNYLAGLCAPLGIVNIDQMDTAIANLINGPLAGTVNVGTFPLFLTKNVVMSQSGVSLSGCCVLGYHSAFAVGANLQVYSPLEVDTAGVFGSGYTNTIAHEIGEAIHDPNIVNPTPPWGNIGQDVGYCQGNFEVGDPLSDGFGTPTNPWTLTGSNGLGYSLQELAYFNWFFGNPNLSAGGYSNHGSLTGYAISCPPGGTN